MTERTMLNFRCPADLLEAIDVIGQERYPSDTAKHGCDRSKTLLDIVRAGIEALSSGKTVLQASDTDKKSVLQISEGNVRQCKTIDATDIEARLATIEERLGKLRA